MALLKSRTSQKNDKLWKSFGQNLRIIVQILFWGKFTVYLIFIFSCKCSKLTLDKFMSFWSETLPVLDVFQLLNEEQTLSLRIFDVCISQTTLCVEAWLGLVLELISHPFSVTFCAFCAFFLPFPIPSPRHIRWFQTDNENSLETLSNRQIKSALIWEKKKKKKGELVVKVLIARLRDEGRAESRGSREKSPLTMVLWAFSQTELVLPVPVFFCFYCPRCVSARFPRGWAGKLIGARILMKGFGVTCK